MRLKVPSLSAWAFLDRVAPLEPYLLDAHETRREGQETAPAPEAGTQGSTGYWVLLGALLGVAGLLPLVLGSIR